MEPCLVIPVTVDKIPVNYYYLHQSVLHFIYYYDGYPALFNRKMNNHNSMNNTFQPKQTLAASLFIMRTTPCLSTILPA